VPRRQRLPDDLKQLCLLCRAGKLFAVQEWIRTGRRHQLPQGHFTNSPLRISIQCGFHSLVEVLLQGGASEQEKNEALVFAVSERNLDLVKLLCEYGADINSIDPEEVFWSRHPAIIAWFIANGMDLESGESIAKAFRDKQREFLGIYMDLRDQVPSARKQAAMALRYHAKEGDLKWVSLLLWAGGDPRLSVPRIDKRECDDEEDDTALNAAIRYGRVEIVKKIRLDPLRDDHTRLLNQYFIRPNPKIIELLIKAGADVANLDPDVTESVFCSFECCLVTSLDDDETCTEEALRCMEILGANGVRWYSPDKHELSRLRRALAGISPHAAIQHLQKIANSGIMEQSVFSELMRTPKMKEILKQSSPEVVELRRYAGRNGLR
jgi:Ankyrin repeats (3 copies)